MTETNLFNEDEIFDLFESEDLNVLTNFIKKYGINSCDRDGRTMLMNFIIEQKINLFNEALKHNPDINHQDDNGFTALHFAVQERFYDAINSLLEREDLQIDLQDVWGNTVLLRLINEEDEDEIDLVKKIIEKGASLDIQNNYEISPRSSMQEITDEKIIDYSKILK